MTDDELMGTKLVAAPATSATMNNEDMLFNEEITAGINYFKFRPSPHLLFSSVADKAPERSCPPGYQRDFKRICKRKF